MKIGNVRLNSIVCLAPMAGFTDRAFRELCIDFGACMTTSEMVSSKGLYYNDKKSMQLMENSSKEHPFAIQLFGSEPDIMAIAAKKALRFNPDIIDINMGCPAPKITSAGSGSALMKNPNLCGKIVYAVKKAVVLPVTVKLRKGWDAQNINAVHIAKICENMGADAICIHGRTRMEMYTGHADWEIIKKIKQSVKIPVIGNGDIKHAEDAKKLLDESKCDMLMLGRATLGNPWIFKEINHLIINNKNLPKVNITEKLQIMEKHVKNMCSYKNERLAIKEARKHICWYLKGFKGAAKFRNKATSINTLKDFYQFCFDLKKETLY